jgi:hypothetical protein
LNACSAHQVQNDPVVGGDSNITITNKSFFSTYRQVKLLSTTVKNLLNMMSLPIQRIPILQNQFLNQSDAIVTEPVFRNDILNKLIFTGVPVNCFNPNNKYPKYCTQLYIEETTTSTSLLLLSL